MGKKLRFYMRGLGIGIIVTALILIISGKFSNNATMSDEQVRVRALELGMVDARQYSLADAAKAEEEKENETKPEKEVLASSQELPPVILPEENENEAKSDADDTNPPETVNENEATENAETSNDTASSTHEGTPGGGAEDVQDTPAAGESEENPVSEETVVTGDVEITITRGSGSDKIARQCAEAGLVSDAAAFDTFLVRNGYSTSLRTGTFTLRIGMTEEEIARILTGKSN